MGPFGATKAVEGRRRRSRRKRGVAPGGEGVDRGGGAGGIGREELLTSEAWYVSDGVTLLTPCA